MVLCLFSSMGGMIFTGWIKEWKRRPVLLVFIAIQCVTTLLNSFMLGRHILAAGYSANYFAIGV